jgi:hypothetical protein
VCRVFKKIKRFKPELQERDYSFQNQLGGVLHDMSSPEITPDMSWPEIIPDTSWPEITPDMSWPEMLSTTNSAAASAGGGEGMSCSYGHGNCFPMQQFPEYDPAR